MLDYPQIRAILPHGASMVLLDRVDRLVPGRELSAVKAVSGTDPCYAGLPPGLPLARYAYPRSLILESFGQAAAVLWHSTTGACAGPDRLLMFAAARDVRFLAQAYPGDVLRHDVRWEHSVADTGFATGSTWVGGRQIAAMGSFIAVLRPPAPSPE